MRTVWQDVRYGARMLAKSPGFTVVTVLTLALGIGANTAIFSLMHQLLLRQLPVKNPGELVVLRAPGLKTGSITSEGDDTEPFSYKMYKGLRDGNQGFSGILARAGFAASVASRGQTERASGELVSGNYFEVLGVQPALGRMFNQDDDRVPGAHPVVVLGSEYWKHRFAGDPSILNQAILVNNTEMTVVGVAQPGFFGVQVGKAPDVYAPMMMAAQMQPNGHDLNQWNDYWLNLLARRKAGVSEQQATTGVNAAYSPLLAEQLSSIKGWPEAKQQRFLNKKIVLSSGAKGRDVLQRDAGTPILALFAMVALVLLIACTNVANLLLARGAGRQREFAIRSAMGASRGRMIRQLVIESLLCAVAGGAAGLVLGTWLMGILISSVASNENIHGLTTQLEPSVLGFALVATLLSGLFFGLLPAWRVTRYGLSDVMKDQGSTSSASVSHVRFRKTLVAGQVAFTLLLLAGAGFFTRTLWNLRNQSLGLKTENVISFSVQPSLNGYDTARTITFLDQLRSRIATLPGVNGIGTSEIPTLEGDNSTSNITAEGGPELSEDLQQVNTDRVSPHYFSAFGVPLISGREFNEGDGASSPKVAVASESMVKRFFPNRNPLGAHFAFGSGKGTGPNIEIVGVVKDTKQAHVRSDDDAYVYLPYAQQKILTQMTFYVRTARDPILAAPVLQSVVRELDPNLPVYDVKTMQRIVDEDLFGESLVATMSASFGVLAALLAALGIYGVLAFLVVQRTREIGIRMAMGAESSDVRILVFREVGAMLVAGTVIGLPLAYLLGRYSESILFGVKASDPLVYVAGLVLVTLIAAAACYIPARRATKVDPLIALRYE